MSRVVLLAVLASTLACGSSPPELQGPLHASREDVLRATVETIAVGIDAEYTSVVPLGERRFLVASSGALAYVDGAAVRTVQPTIAVASATRLASGGMALTSVAGALYVYANDALTPSPAAAAIATPIDSIATGAGTFYAISRGGLFVWRDAALSQLNGVATGARLVAAGGRGSVYVASDTTVHAVEVGAAASEVIGTYASVTALAADSRPGVYVASGNVVERVRLPLLRADSRDAGRETFVFDDPVTALIGYRLMPGVWVRTQQGDVWYLRDGAPPRFLVSHASGARLDDLGRLVVTDGSTIRRYQRADAATQVIVDDAVLGTALDGTTPIEVAAADLDSIIDVTATSGSQTLLVRPNPWRVLASSWTIADGAVVEVNLRSAESTLTSTFTMRVTAAPVPSWDAVADIASVNCTACHYPGAATKSLDESATWLADISDILHRVTVGSMPPRPQAPLSDDAVARLQGWAVAGGAP